MKKRYLGALCAYFLLSISSANATTINLNAITDAANSAQSLALQAGTYTITPTTDAYTAYSLHLGRANSWVWAYEYSSSEIGVIQVGRPPITCGVPGTCFDNANDAFTAQAEASTFTLTSDSTVDFYICDGSDCFSTAGDNVGGLSLELTSVPIPAALWLFVSGFVGILALPKRKNAT